MCVFMCSLPDFKLIANMNLNTERSLQDENMPNLATNEVQDSGMNQTTIEIPRSQTQGSHSEQNVTLTATDQGMMGEEKNLGEPHKNPSLPPRTYSEFSREHQQNTEHANMTSNQNLGITNSTPLQQETHIRRPSTTQNELNGYLASKLLGPVAHLP